MCVPQRRTFQILTPLLWHAFSRPWKQHNLATMSMGLNGERYSLQQPPWLTANQPSTRSLAPRQWGEEEEEDEEKSL